MDTYRDLAERYDRMSSEKPERTEFFSALFERYEVRSVLDCACGTGRDLIAFHRLGMHVEGSDLSEAMLAQAGRNLDQVGVKALLSHRDLCDLSAAYESCFDAVVCLSNSINEVLDESDVINALRGMRSSLRKGGIVVLDQGQTDASMRDPKRYDVLLNDRDLTRVLIMEHEDSLMTVRVLDLLHNEDRNDVTETVVRLRIRLRADWEQLFREAGFSSVSFYGSWGGQPYDCRSSARLIAVAEE